MSELTGKEQKAVRLVKDHKVRIVSRTEAVLVGVVEGDTEGEHHVVIDPEGSHCDCSAGTKSHVTCSHMLAVELLELSQSASRMSVQ